MNLLFNQKFNQAAKDYLLGIIGDSFTVYDFDRAGDDEVLEKIDVLVGNNVPADLLNKTKSLKYIQSTGTGVDRINLELIRQKNIRLFNTHSQSIFVAEFAVSMLLTLVKRLHLHDQNMRKGSWWRPQGIPDDSLFQASTLIDREIGIIGFGAIGRNIFRMLSGFRAKFNINDISQNPIENPQEREINYLGLEDVIKRSDIIFICLPLTPETDNLIGEKYLSMAKESSLWINISRGKIMNEAALYKALENRQIGGAAIDNWSNPLTTEDGKKYPSKDFPYHELPNMLLSPYRAIYVEDKQPHLIDVAENLRRLAAGEELLNEVNLDKGF
jgi:phosphoglycerate dehydrogenase-like enzyme